MKKYPEAVKEKAVLMHLEEGLTIQETIERLGIVSKRRFMAWCEAYRKEGLAGLQQKPKGRPRKNSDREQESEYELKHLRMENELLRNFLYEVGRR